MSAQKSLIKERSDLTIAKALLIAKTEGATCKQIETIRIPLEESSTRAIQSKSKRKPAQCGYCGRDHPRRECSARGKACNICNKKGHFANVYRSKKQDKKSKQTKEQQSHSGTKTGGSTQQYKMKATVARG